MRTFEIELVTKPFAFIMNEATIFTATRNPGSKSVSLSRAPRRNPLAWIALALALTTTGMALAQTKPPEEKKERPPADIAIDSETLGDAEGGVVTRFILRMQIPQTIDPQMPLEIQGSLVAQGELIRNFRYAVQSQDRGRFTFVQVVPEGEIEITVRVLTVSTDDTSPTIVSKTTEKFTSLKIGTPYIAATSDGPEGFIAEGVAPEMSGAVKIRPPKRDLAPNLFVVDVDVKDPVKRVEFWVEGKKILTKNGPPYRTELDLGKLPKRVEVKAIGYDSSGRYVDADAWIVNERQTPLEVKITRTVTPDGVSHIKLSVQNPNNRVLQKIELYAADRKIVEWSRPPYAIDIPGSKLAGVEFIRASVLDDTNYEASDLLFLDGTRYSEEIEVNLVELPVSVIDERGNPVIDLKEGDFKVFEDKKPMKISSFGFATDLPVSVGVLVDHSGSMKERIETARQAAIEFFEQIIGPRDRAFFGAFAWDPSEISPFVSDVSSLRARAGSMPAAEGGTSLYDAIVSGLYRFRTVEGRKALVLVTDGEDTTSRLTYEAMLEYARAARVPLYFIGIGISSMDFTAVSKMKSLAAETGGVAYFVKRVEELEKTYEQLEKELRSQYLISYYTQSTKKDSTYRTVEVKTTRAGAKVRTIRGFIP